MDALQFVDNLTEAIDNGNYSVGIFHDLSKALVTVNNNILLCILSHYGVRSTALSWFKGFLSNREKHVAVNGVNSTQKY